MTRHRAKEIRSSYDVQRPANMPFWNEIVCGDSNALLKLIPSNSVNLVITSPPYFNQRDYGGGIGNEKFASHYIDTLMEIFCESVRIIKPSGSIVFNLGDKYEDSSLLLMPYRFAIAATERCAVKLVNNVTWVKTNPTPRQFKRRLVSSTEPFFHFVKTEEYQYFIDEFMKSDEEPTKPANGNGAGENVGKKYFSLIDQSELTDKQKNMAREALSQVIAETQRGDLDGFRMKIRGIHSEPFGGQDGGRKIQLTKNGFTIIRIYGNPLKKDVISTPVESLKNCPHPAIYPVRIVEEFLRLLTKTGDVVVDPFIGSGSTAVAAVKQQRVFIGFDINAEYCDYARSRLASNEKSPSANPNLIAEKKAMWTPLTVAEYFAGIGLVRMGLEPHGWQVVFANDISEKKFEMYEAFFPDADCHYVADDIYHLNASSVPYATLATCSFPCIDLSLAGNMNGLTEGNHSSAFWGFVQILQAQGEFAPPLVLVENVPGWLYSNEGNDFRITVQALNRLGYACDVFILDALRFTPQSRLRVFLVGTRLPTAQTTAELILTRPKSLLSDQLKKSIRANKELRWFYNELPEPPPLKTGGLSKIIEQMSDADERWWSEEETNRHVAMMNEAHHDRVMQLAHGAQITYRTFFRRRRLEQQRAEVRDDDLSGCLRTAVGGSGKQFLIRAGKGKIKMRAMTPREYARLQGVPDAFPIRVNGVQALTGFGDAVCVPAISWIAEHLLNPLAQNGSPQYKQELPRAQLFLLENGRQSQTHRPSENDASRQRKTHTA